MFRAGFELDGHVSTFVYKPYNEWLKNNLHSNDWKVKSHPFHGNRCVLWMRNLNDAIIFGMISNRLPKKNYKLFLSLYSRYIVVLIFLMILIAEGCFRDFLSYILDRKIKSNDGEHGWIGRLGDKLDAWDQSEFGDDNPKSRLYV